MKIKLPIVLTLSLFCFTLQAQIVDKTEERAKQKTNQRIDRKIDSGIDSGLDAIEGLFKKKKNSSDDSRPQDTSNDQNLNTNNDDASAAVNKAMLSLFGGSGKADVADNYEFDHSIDMKMEYFDKKGKLSGTNNMVMLIADNAPQSGMITDVEGTSSLIIFDLKTEKMISLIDASGQKIGMVMSFSADTFDESEESTEDFKQPVITPTGKRKTISGYACSEYKVENIEGDEDAEIFLWMTKESDMNWMNAFGAMSKSNKDISMRGAMPSTYPDGAVVEMVSTYKQSGEKSVITVNKFGKNDKRKISTASYTFLSMGANPAAPASGQ